MTYVISSTSTKWSLSLSIFGAKMLKPSGESVERNLNVVKFHSTLCQHLCSQGCLC